MVGLLRWVTSAYRVMASTLFTFAVTSVLHVRVLTSLLRWCFVRMGTLGRSWLRMTTCVMLFTLLCTHWLRCRGLVLRNYCLVGWWMVCALVTTSWLGQYVVSVVVMVGVGRGLTLLTTWLVSWLVLGASTYLHLLVYLRNRSHLLSGRLGTRLTNVARCLLCLLTSVL